MFETLLHITWIRYDLAFDKKEGIARGIECLSFWELTIYLNHCRLLECYGNIKYNQRMNGLYMYAFLLYF